MAEWRRHGKDDANEDWKDQMGRHPGNNQDGNSADGQEGTGSGRGHNKFWGNRGDNDSGRGHGGRGHSGKDSDSKGDSGSESSGYVESDAVKQWRELMNAQMGMKPEDYTSQWQPQINEVLNSIMNRKDFSYDLNADALYQQYKDRYVNLGQQAMMDTMGQAAALTGGYGNSAAQMVGQQTYQGYLQGLTDKIPELYQIALDKYNQEGQDLYQKYGLLNTQEQNDYDRWQNAFNRWLSERDFTTGRYDTERGFDYGTYRDTVSDEQWKAEMEAQERQWQAQLAEERRQFDLQMAAANASASGGGGGGGGSGGSSGGGTSSATSDNGDEAYRLYQQAVSQGFGSSNALNALSASGYTDSAISSAMNKYEEEVIKPLSNPTKTKNGTM